MYNSDFEDLMDSINNFAKGLGFKNGIDWAQTAQTEGEISYSEYCDYNNCHNLRVRFSHGSARDIVVSKKTYQITQNFYKKIIRSSLVKSSNIKANLPNGGFRGDSFKKEFNITKDGKTYNFLFDIVYEYNYLDDGYKGAYATGYFIHILKAPYFDYALERLHEFHIIREGPGRGHICWNKNITGFEEANAVMLVWTKRYVNLIIEIIKDRNITESQLMKKVKNKGILPSGTFRSQNKKVWHSMPRKEIYIERKVYESIMNKLGTLKPELGGMLGYSESQNIIETFVFDKGARVNYVEYNPNINLLNEIIHGEWEKKDICLAGFVHSHPGNFTILSDADIEYALRIIDAFDLEYLFMPIVTSKFDSKAYMYPYVVNRNGRVEKALLTIFDEEKVKRNNSTAKENKVNTEIKETTKENDYIKDKNVKEEQKEISKQNDQAIEEIMIEDINIDDIDMDSEMLKKIEVEFDSMNQSKKDNSGTFDRINNVIDINYMKNCTIIGIGCGGSRGFFEDMVRVGVGNFILIDGDKSSVTNIASQNGYISDIGKFKTEALKARMLDINDKINVTCINEMFTPKLVFKNYNIDLKTLNNKQTLICAFTDDFYAQRLAEETAFALEMPYLSAQHHFAGNTSEVTYYYPYITKYRVKDVLKTRYESYEKGFVNNVTSEGSPIFNTTRLNSLCEKIATGLLLYDLNKENEYSRFVNERRENNIIIIRQKNLAFCDNPLKELFENNDTDFFDDVLWINPEDIW